MRHPPSLHPTLWETGVLLALLLGNMLNSSVRRRIQRSPGFSVQTYKSSSLPLAELSTAANARGPRWSQYNSNINSYRSSTDGRTPEKNIEDKSGERQEYFAGKLKNKTKISLKELQRKKWIKGQDQPVIQFNPITPGGDKTDMDGAGVCEVSSPSHSCCFLLCLLCGLGQG